MNKHIFTAVLLSLAASAHAHHAAAPHFYLDQTITLEGVITEWKFVNPHSYVYLDVTDDDGVTSNWRCSLTTITRLTRRGWTAETLKPGQRVTLTASPARREDNHCFFRSLQFADGITIESGEDIAGKLGTGDHSPGTGQPTVAVAEAAPEYQRYLPNGQPNLHGPWISPPTNFVPGRGIPMGMGMGPGSADLPAPTEAGARASAGYDVIYDNPALACHPINIVSAWPADGAGNTVYQEDDQITLQYGFMDLARTLHLDQSGHPEDIEPSLEGHSIGRWEADVLVVHTIGFDQGVLSVGNGRMHSEQMEVTERFEVAEDGQTLTRSFTVHDPVFLQSDWIGKDVLHRTDEPQAPYDCISLEGANNERPME
jgi:hypothetical protein